MRSPYAQAACLLGLAVLSSGLGPSPASFQEREPIAPIVAGLAHRALDERGRGRVLLGELGCVNCHAPPDEAGLDARRGPDLAEVGNRLRADYLPRFLADPHAVDPGSTMPDMLLERDAAARDEVALALSDYLRSLASVTSVDDTIDDSAAARGKSLFHQVGCVACHAPRDEDGRELSLPDSLPLGDLAAKYRSAGLRAFLLAPDEVRPDSRMPDLHLTPAEAHELTSYLLAGAKAAAPPAALEPQRVARGRALFAERNCAACHDMAGGAQAAARAARPLRSLAHGHGGCLVDAPGPFPAYELSSEQQNDIAAALASLEASVPDEQRIRERLAARNCMACHQRGDSGGIAPERNQYFTTNDERMGEDSRVPPPLTLVGAKLQLDWLIDAIAHGQSVRPYLNTRMPGFGAAFANELGEQLARVDTLPPLVLPGVPLDEERGQEIRALGRELVGEKGLNCIACHRFAGEQVGVMAAVDLVDSTGQRLQRAWFHRYLRAPADFRAGTLMPQYFADTVPSRRESDIPLQIDALWQYLAEGRNAREPDGMRHPAIELVVGSETVLLRRSAQNTGKRALSVGYPGGVNLTFDAESLGLDQIWWGKFIDASGVWYGQGSGETHPLSARLARLPLGPAFVVLPDADAPWPSASRRELGQQWLGYDLDAEQRPTFRYVCAGVTISDTPLAVAADGPAGSTTLATLRRTLTFASDQDVTLRFRAAVDARVEDLGHGEVAVGSALHLQLQPGAFRIRPVAQERELTVDIPLRQGRAELVIDYRWQEESK